MEELPIQSVIPRIRTALREHSRLVIEAPPGAGKTTMAPLALLDEAWLAGKCIIMLEPRRLAARAAATRMASLLDETIGQTVGYRVRGESRVSARTRIEVVTEGILTRRIQADPELTGVGLVIFDEFHERNLHADLGLALSLDVQAGLRDDLRLALMSATLNATTIARRLDAITVSCEGRCHTVDTHYCGDLKAWETTDGVVATIRRALGETDGSILAFLPGAGEIRRAYESLSHTVADDIVLAPLYGDLPLERQDQAIRPAPTGKRKIVLATSIAETSITIQGIRVVIDSGLMRTSRFDPNTGMTRLETLRLTKASADQRRGRAGRTGPGTCYRLWSQATHNGLEPDTRPELLSTDLATLVLELANWGVTNPNDLTWLDAPPESTFTEGRKLLQQLEAVDANGRITNHGKVMLKFGMHPRLAHMLLRANEQGLGRLACHLAALISERDILKPNLERTDSNILSRIDVLFHNARIPGYSTDFRACQRVKQTARDTMQRLAVLTTHKNTSSPTTSKTGSSDVGRLLALAYPDRIGRRRPGSELHYLLVNGRGASLSIEQSLSRHEFIVATNVDGAGSNARIFLAAPIDRTDIDDLFRPQIAEADTVEWNNQTQAVHAQRRHMLGALALDEARLPQPRSEDCLVAMLTGIRSLGINALPWTQASTTLRQRMAFLHRNFPDEWPDVSDEALLSTLEAWLGPFINGVTKAGQLSKVDLCPALLSLLDWPRQRRLDEFAPTHYRVPSNANIRLDYSGETPVLPARIQQLFTLMETPRVAGGRIPILIHLLSPASRPIQVTQDLASFWGNTYTHVRKELKGRYPKHYWPDDPLSATPTNRVRPNA